MNSHCENFEAAVRAALPELRLLVNEPMCRHTSFRIGGPADYLAIPQSEAQLAALLELGRGHQVPVTIVGNGSNLLVRDKGIRGLVVKMAGGLMTLACDGDTITAGAGVALAAVAHFAATHKLAGMEFAVGIPGSLGGAVFMNAGAYDGDMAAVVGRVSAITLAGEKINFAREALAFAYRHSCLQENQCIVTTVELRLRRGDAAAIKAKMDDYTERRITKQPLHVPNAGSAFKRPPGHFAGALIEKAGMKGFAVGGAQVSEKHAGFIVNTGGATADDVLRLIAAVQEKVLALTNVKLEPEVRVLGE